MKKYCVIARFDDKTNNIFSIWKEKAHSLQHTHYADKPWSPHLTIGVYEDVNIQELCNWTHEYTANKLKLPILFNSLGIFTHGKNLDIDVIFVNPSTSLALVDFYYGYHQKFDDYCGKSGYEYSKTFGNPVFHSTVTICNKNDFNQVFDYLRDEFILTRGEIIALEVYEIPMKLIKRYELI